jgi:hypothetical protein
MRQLVHGRRDDVAAPWQRTAAGSNLLGDDGGLGVTIFEEMTTLAARTGAINLGQGFPDEDGPAEIAAAAMDAIRNGANQYAPGKGTLTLRTAVAHHQERFYGLTPDPETEIIVTTGATEALGAGHSALCLRGVGVSRADLYGDASHADHRLRPALVFRLVYLGTERPDRRPDHYRRRAHPACGRLDAAARLILPVQPGSLLGIHVAGALLTLEKGAC